MQSKFKIVSILMVILLVLCGSYVTYQYSNNKKGNEKGDFNGPNRLIFKKSVNVLYIEARINVSPVNWEGMIPNQVEFYCVPPVINVNATNITTSKAYAKADINFVDFKDLKAIIVIDYILPWGYVMLWPRLAIFIVNDGGYLINEAFNKTNLAYEIEYTNGSFQVLNFNVINNPINFTYIVQDKAKRNITFTEQHVFNFYSNISMDEYNMGSGCE